MLSQGHGSKRPRKQEQAIAALLECATVKQAAEKAGLGERTLRTWLKIPEFRDAYHEARRACVDQAVSRLERNFEFPVAVLQKIAGDLSAPAYARVSAAKGLLEAGFKAVELFTSLPDGHLPQSAVGPASCVGDVTGAGPHYDGGASVSAALSSAV